MAYLNLPSLLLQPIHLTFHLVRVNLSRSLSSLKLLMQYLTQLLPHLKQLQPHQHLKQLPMHLRPKQL
ncbi:hypothetical protein TYRP_011142 [Tyrophagus putrescentiae]|nr:hypothetical protein TYRP_011142 [Tyrophagus putrescentiae]